MFIETTDANEGMIVDDKPTFEDWYFDDNFESDIIKISDKTKAYTDDLVKRTIKYKKIEIGFKSEDDYDDDKNYNNNNKTMTSDEI